MTQGRHPGPLKPIIGSLEALPPTVIKGASRALIYYYAELFGFEVVTRVTPEGVEVWRIK